MIHVRGVRAHPLRARWSSRWSRGALSGAVLAGAGLAWALVSGLGQPIVAGAGSTASAPAAVDAGRPAPAPAIPAPGAAPGTGGDAMPVVRVRDSATGRFLDADLQVQDSAARAVADRLGRVPPHGARLAGLPHGDYQLSVRVPGYRPLSSRLHVDGRRALPVTFWLAAERPSSAPERRALAALECGACAVVAGHVHDPSSGRPLAGIEVLADAGGRAVTDDRGAFELVLQAAPATARDPEALPQTTALTFRGHGYRQRLEGVALYADSHELVVDLRRGTAAPADLSHVQMTAGDARARRAAPEVAVAIEAERARTDRRKALDAGDPAALALARRLAQQAASIPVPGSIRVGTGCSGRSCSGVSVYAMEDYVGRGLDDEWIASWQPASLAAGAIAYRSYGAYYVAHPVSGQYDICSTTSCQVFRSGSTASTLAAAAATRGVVLTRDGQTVAFSEYSAENNAWDDPSDGLSCSNPDLSCGNGRNGSPANGWPCLSDSVGSGRGCFGHGRGMSQWGTQRWAANHGRDWKWIANHYYNGNGNPGGMRNAFLANVDDGGGGATTMLDNFEDGVGRFGTAPTYSGSTTGVSAASAGARNCATRHGGACSLGVRLVDDPGSEAAWAVRLLSGMGNPAANAPLARDGRIGFWVWSGGSGMSVGVGIDDSDGTERSVSRSIPANGWTWVEWSLSDAAQWNAWAGNGNGAIDAATVKLDAIWFYRAQTRYDVQLYVDEVQLRR